MAGYSKKSLADKLGIKPGKKLHLSNAPDGYGRTLGTLPTGATMLKALQGPCDFIQFFTKEKSELKAAFPKLKKNLATDGILWISWPKGASKIKTDVNGQIRFSASPLALSNQHSAISTQQSALSIRP